jgi:hypothetical protein
MRRAEEEAKFTIQMRAHRGFRLSQHFVDFSPLNDLKSPPTVWCGSKVIKRITLATFHALTLRRAGLPSPANVALDATVIN